MIPFIKALLKRFNNLLWSSITNRLKTYHFVYVDICVYGGQVSLSVTSLFTVYMEGRGQLAGVGSFLLACGSRAELKLSGLVASVFIYWAILLALHLLFYCRAICWTWCSSDALDQLGNQVQDLAHFLFLTASTRLAAMPSFFHGC